MNRFRRYLLCGAGVSLLALLVTLTPAGPAIASSMKPLLVEVVNNPTVQAQQSGSWNVGINGAIQVGNSASSPVPVRDVENPAREPFSASLNCSNTTTNTCAGSISVLAGKRMVVEFVSGRVSVGSGNELTSVFIVTGGKEHFLLAHKSPATPTSGTRFDVSQPLRLYSDPGGDVSLHVEISGIGASTLIGRISGYLVDCGPGTGCPIP